MANSSATRPLDLDNIWPVGSIYMNVSNISPATIFGGTWEALEDRFLVGAGSTYTGATTGGARTHTLITDELPSHNHTFTGSSVTSGNESVGHTHNYKDYYASNPSGTAISVAQLASHNHLQLPFYAGQGSQAIGLQNVGSGGSATRYHGGYTDNTGSGNTHTHTAQNTNTTRTSEGISANHTHSVTASGTIGNTGSGTAFSTEPPYLVVYMWKRIS